TRSEFPFYKKGNIRELLANTTPPSLPPPLLKKGNLPPVLLADTSWFKIFFTQFLLQMLIANFIIVFFIVL
ncbi:MAG: hypothetical protein EBT55_03050, partial [Proteobacteria bacterium]|nr:hypothetical protein [Pseudomonadota bacterium]